MKVIQCDCCKKIIEDPYEVKFREYLLEAEYNSVGVFPVKSKRKSVLDLCADCYNNLQVMKIKDSADVITLFAELLKSRYCNFQHPYVFKERYISISESQFDDLVKMFRVIK